MPSNTAIVVQKPGESKAVEASIPKLRDDYLLVKTKAVALNPTDWKHIEWLTTEGARVSQPPSLYPSSRPMLIGFCRLDVITPVSSRKSEVQLQRTSRRAIVYAVSVTVETK